MMTIWFGNSGDFVNICMKSLIFLKLSSPLTCSFFTRMQRLNNEQSILVMQAKDSQFSHSIATGQISWERHHSKMSSHNVIMSSVFDLYRYLCCHND